MNNPLLTPAEAAVHLSLSKSCLARWRQDGIGPRYIKLSEAAVRYPLADLDEWLESKRVAQ